ncbi:MAG: hypothetical protein AB7V77_05835 [Candidatus Woesearchaeota archaeon]
MTKLKLSEIKKEIIGKNLKTIITLDLDEKLISTITGEDEYHSISNCQLMIFDNVDILFVDYDCDGYRSGNWFLIKLELKFFLDKGLTKGIKKINSIVRDIQSISLDGKNFILLTTDDYVVTMGQDDTDSYYPRNFFSVEETKDFAILNYVDKSKTNSISKEMENYLYSFIVDTNQEINLVESIEDNEKLKNEFKEWFNID